MYVGESCGDWRMGRKSLRGQLVLSHIQLCDPMNYSPPGSPVYGISQARILEWVALFFSRGSS